MDIQKLYNQLSQDPNYTDIGNNIQEFANNYFDDDNNTAPAIIQEKQPLELSERLTNAINEFCLEATCISGSMLEKYILARVLVGIINEAMWALHDGVASSQDIDIAMRLGTNYPKGPIEWANLIGDNKVQELLYALNETVADNRFTPPPQANV